MNTVGMSQKSAVVELAQSRWIVSSALAREIILFTCFNILLVASAQVAIPLPFTAVPITLQTFGVLVAALALGRTRAVALMVAYLAEGAMGLPVFAGGVGGPQALVGPTGGYLFGFVVSAGFVGALADRGWDRSYFKALFTLTGGTALIFACGVAWLSRFVDGATLLTAGLIPFLPGAALKILAAFWISPSLSKLNE